MNKNHNLFEKITEKYGGLICLLLSVILLFIFFGNLIMSPNTTFFTKGGDGFRTYTSTIYHIKYDSDYLETQNMNYPYGEGIFFLDLQPFISNTIKFVSNNIIDISEYTTGIINLIMLLSLLISPLIFYFLLKKLKIPELLSILSALFITYLSPQIMRMGGHFSLSYIIIFPLFILLTIKFFEKPTFKTSVSISLLFSLLSLIHLYFIPLLYPSLIVIWSIFLYKKEKFRKTKFIYLHLFLQFIIPLSTIIFVTYISKELPNRTQNPWGITYFRGYPEGVWLPFNRPYGRFLHNIMTFKHITWEAWSYVGLTATIATLIFAGRLFVCLLKRNWYALIRPTDKAELNIMLWISLAMLLYSFGIPIILIDETKYYLLGKLLQFRGLARIGWFYFYIINIVTVYWLSKWKINNKRIWIKYSVLTIAILMLAYDSWLNVRGQEYYLNNTSQIRNEKGEIKYEWEKTISPEKYQAIIPIPYFAVGTENIWYGPNCESPEFSYLLSLKTGLPLVALMGGRSSIDITYRNLQFVLEPYRPIETLKYCNKKPFLLAVKNCDKITASEQNLIKLAEKTGNIIYQKNNIKLISLKYEVLNTISDKLYSEIKNEMDNRKLYRHEETYSSDSVKNYHYESFYGNLSNNAYMGVDAYEGIMKKENTIFNDVIKGYDTTKNYIVSVWIGAIYKDMTARSKMKLYAKNKKGEIYNYQEIQLFRKIKIIDKQWALVEVPIKLNSSEDSLCISVKNRRMNKTKLFVDELLIRPKETDVYVKFPEYTGKNNRFFPIEE